MRGELLTGSFGLISIPLCFLITAWFMLQELVLFTQFTPEQELLADLGSPELEGRRGRLPYLQDPLEGVDKPAYGATIYVVNAHYQNVLVMSWALSVGRLTPQRGEGEPYFCSYDPTRM